MATKKRGGRKALKGQELKAAKSDISRLKKLGLYKGDARKQPTRYALDQRKRFKDVLTKQAKVVTVPKRSAAREYTQIYKTKYRKVVVPTRAGEKLFYNKKSGEIFSYNKEYGHSIRRIFPKKPLTEAEAEKISRGKNVRYAIPIGQGDTMRRIRFTEFSELKAYMSSDSLKGYNNWERYVEIEEILDDGEDDGDDYE